MSEQPTAIPQVDVADAAERFSSGTALLVDVREQDELAQVHVPGAAHVPMSNFVDAARSLPADRPLLMICASGRRSLVAADHLRRNGHADVSNVAGGIVEWQKRGLPTARGSAGG